MRSLLPCLLVTVFLFAAGPAAAQQYQYDAAGRLTAAIYPDGGSIRYEYDANSNITRVHYASGGGGGLVPPDGVIDTPADNVSITAGQTVNFTGTGTDPDGATPLTYLWDFDSGATDSTDEDPGDVAFANAGVYTVEFTVTDASGLADPTPDTVVVTVTAASGGGSGGGSAGGGGGGGSLLLLPMICAAAWLLRRRRGVLLLGLLLAGGAQAQSWSPMNSPTSENLNDVWASSADNAWAVGDAGTVLHYDGASWTPVDVGTTTDLTGIWGASADDIMVVGASGLVLQYDGSAWTAVDVGAGAMPLTDVWYTAGGARHVLGTRGVWIDSGGGWERQFLDTSFDGRTDNPRTSMSAIRASQNHLFIAGNGNSGGEPVIFVDLEEVGRWDTSALAVFADDQVFAVGEQNLRVDGGDPTVGNTANWQFFSTGATGNAAWGSAPDNVYVAGEFGTYARIVHFDGTDWTSVVDVNFRQFHGIHGVDARTIFAVGSLGMIYGYVEPPPTPTAANFPFAGVTEGNVNTYTGELVYEVTDFSIGSDPLELRRYYASKLWVQGTVGERMGENWTHNYEWRIDAGFGPGGDQVRITDYRGTEYLFDAGGTSRALVSPTWANVSLTEDADRYFFTDHDEERIRAFDKLTGNLVWIEDRNGNRHTLAYNSGYLVSVSNGKANLIAFEYTPNGRLLRAYLPQNNEEMEVSFTYNGGLLTGVTAPGNVQTGYTYDGGAFLTAVDVAGAVEKEWDYGAQDRVVATTYTGGGPFIYTYDGDQFTVSEPGATIRTFTHDAAGRLLSQVNGVGAAESWTYDGEGRRISYRDALGRTTNWAYDAVHRKVVSLTQPGGFTTTFDYVAGSSGMGMPFHDLVEVTHPDAALETFDHDAFGNVVSYFDEERDRWDYYYDASGELEQVVNPEGGPTTFTRNADGGIASVTDPNNRTTQYSYDAFQRLTRVDYPDGSAAVLEYSTRFRPDRVTLRSGAVFDYSFDGGDRLVRVDRSDGYFEQYGYDTAGAIVSETLPGNRTTEYRYDARRNIDRVLAADLTFELFQYDAADRLVRYTDPDDRAWQFEYAPDDALTAVIRPDGNRIEYDRNDDPRGLLGAISAGTESTTFSYDSRGRLGTATDPRQRTNTVTRNSRGDIERIVTEPVGTERAYEHDALGNVIRYTTPGGGAWNRVYGDDGLLDSSTNPLGNTTSYLRDALNRIESIDRADGTGIEVTYASSGLPQRIVASDGAGIDIDSTPEGYVVGGTGLLLGRTPTGKVSDSNGILIAYDERELIESITLAPGKVVEFDYNDRGDVVSVRDWEGGETSLSYTQAGYLAGLTYPNATTTAYTYDAADNITAIDYGANGSITLNRNAGGRVESAIRNLPGPDALPDEDRQYSYDAASQRVGATYDQRGNLLNDGQRSWTWDGLDRLVGIDGGLSLDYDALGSLVGIDGSESRDFVINYALDIPSVSIELDANGSVNWYTVHTPDGRLLYRMNESGDRQHYHFDESGHTRFMTDDAAQVIQTYAIAPHGEVYDESGSVDNEYIVAAEFGGRNIDESTTWVIGARYNDARTGHFLSPERGAPPSAEEGVLVFDGSLGRTVTPGGTDALLPDNAWPAGDEDFFRPLRLRFPDRPEKADHAPLPWPGAVAGPGDEDRAPDGWLRRTGFGALLFGSDEPPAPKPKPPVSSILKEAPGTVLSN